MEQNDSKSVPSSQKANARSSRSRTRKALHSNNSNQLARSASVGRFKSTSRVRGGADNCALLIKRNPETVNQNPDKNEPTHKSPPNDSDI